MPPLTPEHIVDGLVPEDPRVSPEGRWVAFAAGPVGKAEEHPRSAIWLAPVDGAAPARALTAGTANDRSPRWSADGRAIFFLSDRAERGKAQVYRIAVDGGEAGPMTDWPGGVSGFVPLADGDGLTFWGKDGPTPEDERRERERDDARVWGERRPVARLRILDLGTRAVRTIDALADRHVAEVAPRPDGGPLAVFSWSMPIISIICPAPTRFGSMRWPEEGSAISPKCTAAVVASESMKAVKLTPNSSWLSTSRC